MSDPTSNPPPGGRSQPIGTSATDSANVMQVPRGEHVFREGEFPGAMYLIRRGRLRIYRTENSREIDLEVLEENQIVGELSFLDGSLRSASAQALSDVTLMKISGPAFAKTLDGLPDWLKILVRTLCLRLRTANTKIRGRDE